MDLLVFGPKLVQRLVAGERREDVLELLLERLEGGEREGLVVVLEQALEAASRPFALDVDVHGSRSRRVTRRGARLVVGRGALLLVTRRGRGGVGGAAPVRLALVLLAAGCRAPRLRPVGQRSERSCRSARARRGRRGVALRLAAAKDGANPHPR